MICVLSGFCRKITKIIAYMQDFHYFCAVKWFKRIFLFLLFAAFSLAARAEDFALADIIADIYRAVTELGEADYEQLQTDLYALHQSPVDLNHTSDEELRQLYFLSPRQIDDILAYAYRHPFQSLYELRLIPSLADYDIRNLLPFVTLSSSPPAALPVGVGGKLSHELLTRVDARDIENAATDPVYVAARYRLDYRRRITFGCQLRRPPGGAGKDLQYNAYLRLKDIGMLHTLVAGHFQASFGQGLVLAPVFHNGKSVYAANVGTTAQGLNYYSSTDGAGLQGAGATLRHAFNARTRLDATALYSLKRANDSTLHHLVGANLTLRHRQLEVQLTAIENIWSDSIRPYRNTAYNQHYFRGRNQAVVGASARYHYGWFDAFAELATTQNTESLISNTPHWGVGVIGGSRFYPASGVSLTALYRYYSPYFDNPLGFAFSETSRLGDENGGYLGFDITRLSRWRFSGYADVFRFSGAKYGIPEYPSVGYDALAEIRYHLPSHASQPNRQTDSQLLLRLRARQKGTTATYSTRFQWDWSRGKLSLRSTAEANLVREKPRASQPQTTYGVTVYQDISYSPLEPLRFTFRLQFFDAREWANRIYCYEHDVLYAYSSSAVYGLGGRAYLSLKWQIIQPLALYLKLSETLYASSWAFAHNRRPTRTDVHLLLRLSL